MASYIAKDRQKKKQIQLTGTHQMLKARKDMVFNNAGGAVFAITPWQQLERFLILGSEGGSYYVGEQKLTVDNAKNVEKCIKEDGISAVDIIVEVSKAGRAPKNDPALLALALAATTGDTETRGYAMAMLPEVARTGTHLFHFLEYANAIRGWGRLMREGVANWYNRLDVEKLAYQIVKYQQRDGWSHRDALRLAHPNPSDDATRSNLYRYIVKSAEGIAQGSPMPGVVIAFEQAKTANTGTLVKLITDYDLPREAIPTEKLNELAVWEALLEKMPMTAMIRNLGKMTSIGLLQSGSDATAKVVNAVTDDEILKKARVHPFTILVALNQYSQGRGLRGSLVWSPVAQIRNALDEGFYRAFGVIVPSGKKTCLALDVSGSMHGAVIANTLITAAQGAMAMAMVTMRSEAQADWKLMGFGTTFHELTMIKPSTKLDAATTITRHMNFGGTNCSLPMIWAAQNNLKFDTFVVYTDNETWAGAIHPFEAINKYRQKMGIPARLVVVGMVSTKFSIADPKDPGMLDVVGFDTTAPDVIAGFSSGEF